MNNLRRVKNQLQNVLDSDDTFAKGGHQVIKIRRPKKNIPAWVSNRDKIRDMLLRAFPRMHNDPEQRRRAGRWARVINLYFRQGWSRGQIAEELSMTYGHVNTMILGIKRAAQGLRYDGRGKKKSRSYSNI